MPHHGSIPLNVLTKIEAGVAACLGVHKRFTEAASQITCQVVFFL